MLALPSWQHCKPSIEWNGGKQEAAIQKSTKTSIKSLTSISGTNSSEWIRRVLLVSIPLIVWVEFITKLTTDWSTNSQYEFGYFVPFFILYLLGRRWNCHPNASTLRSSRSATLVGLAILILLLPTQIIQEANPDWRPLNWFHASIVIILSLVPISIIGGWVWVRHFSFPFLLIFAALPWPLATEQTVLQGLSGAVTTVTVELLNIANIPALQRGNVIDLAAGSVGVADACSGIRSLAGTLMASLFFGEFFRLQALRRFILVIGACAVSFGLNLCRAFFLSWRAAVEGVESIERWHDPAGFTIFSISFASLWFIANLMVKGHLQNEPPAPATFKLPALPYKWIAACALWPLAILGITESWYRFHEGRRPESIAWNVRWPDESESFQFSKVPEETRSILRYTKGKSATFHWDDGSTWQVFFFHWAPGRSSVQLATMHRPEVCLPAIGYKFVAEAGPLQIALQGADLPFTGSVFDCDGRNVYVYRCLWEDFSIPGLTRNRNFDMSLKGRMRGAWYGRRNLGQRMLQVAIVGVVSAEAAHEQLRRRLSSLIKLEG